MYRSLHTVVIFTISLLLVGCVPAPAPKPSTSSTHSRPTMGTPIGQVNGYREYGYPPRDYRQRIKNYFANKLKRADHAKYTFSAPVRAYKRKGLAYGGDVAWRGWLVDVAIAVPSRTGRLQKPKPYMVLFKGDVIVEDILGSNHKLITRVGK